VNAGRICLLVAVCCLAWSGEVRVDASCVWEDKDGYTPVQVRIEALIAPVDVRLEVQLGESRATASVRVEPGRTTSTTVLLPCNPGYGSPVLRWRSDNERGEEGVPVTIEHLAIDLVALDPSEQLPVPALKMLIEEKVTESHSSGRSYRSSGGERVRRIAGDALPDRWQGWPAWMTLVTTPNGEVGLNQAQREAIATWTRLGGALFVSDAASEPAWRKLGAIVTVLDPGTADQPALITRLTSVRTADGRPVNHPVPGTSELPTGWFLTLAITFAVVAGPLNLWWTIRRRQPWLLLITTPLISLGTCALLIVIALASDGIGKQRSAMQIALIDLEAQRTSVFHGITWFCGIAPGPFALDREDRLQPMDEADYDNRWRRDRPALELDWRQGQSVLGSWIPARVNRQLACTQARPERRRISIVRSAGGWQVGNGLDVEIRELHWIDSAGLGWQATGLAPGAEQDLIPSQRAAPTPDVRRLGLDARLALNGAGRIAGSWVARLAQPLHPVPGPTAQDREPIEAWAIGTLMPAAASPGAF